MSNKETKTMKEHLAPDDPKVLATNLYKQNLEIVSKNKVLSLLGKLYEASILTLSPKDIADKIVGVVQSELDLESVSLFRFDIDKHKLLPLAIANSERLKPIVNELDKMFLDKILDFNKNSILSKVIDTKESIYSESAEDFWNDISGHKVGKEILKNSHIRSLTVFPLLIQDEPIGLIAINVNRTNDDIAEFEKETIDSLVNVVAVALDKALLYEQLMIANQQLKALDKARAEFISIASHQLRTPPATIKWYLGAVLAGDFGKLSEELKAALERTNVTNEAQISTIDDLLNASRIERGKLEFFFQPANMAPMVSQLVEQLQPLAKMHKQTIIYKAPTDVIPDMIMDGEKVRQVINNMIDNAIKYSKQGDIQVMLENDGQNIIVKIKDHGRGMTKEEQDMLFQKYSRGKDSATHATGLGLGMYVAKVIVEQHNGRIWAESDGVGKGTTFAFSVPIESKIQKTTVDLIENQS